MAKRIVWTEPAKADIRGIDQPIAMQILKTLGRYVLTGEGATKRLKDVSAAANPITGTRSQDLLPGLRRLHQN